VSWATLAGPGGKRLSILEEETNVSEGSRVETQTEIAKHAGEGKTPPSKPRCPLRTLEHLSVSMHQLTQCIAVTQQILLIYDNINMVWKVAEQIIGRTGKSPISITSDTVLRLSWKKMADAVENGTCVTAVPLFKAKEEDMRTRDTDDTFDHAPPLSLQDIKLTPEECKCQHEYLIYTILQIAVWHGGDDLQKHQNKLVETQPAMHQKIEPHKSELHPLPAMNIDKSSTTGNAEVINAIMKELNIPMTKDEFVKTIKFISKKILVLFLLIPFLPPK